MKIKNCKHPNIVKYFDSWTEGHPETFYIQMELCEKDNLADWMKKNKEHSERSSKIFDILIQIVNALKHIHSIGLIHRDLKVNLKLCVGYNRLLNCSHID